MKELKIISTLTLLVIILLVNQSQKKEIALKTGDISFISLKSTNNSGFSIITFVNLPPKTKIHFTDSEWNGNHFGSDENDILWKTGKNAIQAGSIINFTNLDSNPSVTYGVLFGSMKISKKNDAIFAYLGYEKMPIKFLAAVANDELGYGTLINTNLVDGKTAITYPKDISYSNNYQNVNEYISALNNMCNYTYKESVTLKRSY